MKIIVIVIKKTYFIYYHYTMIYLLYLYVSLFSGMHFSGGCIVRLHDVILGKDYTTRRRNGQSYRIKKLLFIQCYFVLVLSGQDGQPSECLIVSLHLPNAV